MGENTKKLLAVVLAFCMTVMFTTHHFAFSQDARNIDIHRIDGNDVEIARGPHTRATTPRVGQRLSTGNIVTTGNETQVYFRLDTDSILKMDERSEVQVASNQERLSLTVRSGSALVNAATQNPGQSLETRIGNMGIGVRGTLFTVSRDSGYEVWINMLSGIGVVEMQDDFGNIIEIMLMAGETMRVFDVFLEDAEANLFEIVDQLYAITRLDFYYMNLFELSTIWDNRYYLIEIGTITPEQLDLIAVLMEFRRQERDERRLDVTDVQNLRILLPGGGTRQSAFSGLGLSGGGLSGGGLGGLSGAGLPGGGSLGAGAWAGPGGIGGAGGTGSVGGGTGTTDGTGGTTGGTGGTTNGTGDGGGGGAGGGGITDFITIRGVNYPTSLTSLNLSGMNLTDAEIAPLNRMTNLTTLNLNNNLLTNLTPLSGLTNLQSLSLAGNNFSAVTGFGFQTFGLGILGVGSAGSYQPFQPFNVGTGLAPLANLRNLRILHLNNNNITNVDHLASLTNLQRLNIANNSITDLTPLIGLTNVYAFWYHDNPIVYTLPVTVWLDGITYVNEEPTPPTPPPATLTGVTVNPTTANLTVGSTRQLAATHLPSSATGVQLNWSSNAPTVATVSANGLVTAVSAGSATITVTATQNGRTVTADSIITVTEPPPQGDPVATLLLQQYVDSRINNAPGSFDVIDIGHFGPSIFLTDTIIINSAGRVVLTSSAPITLFAAPFMRHIIFNTPALRLTGPITLDGIGMGGGEAGQGILISGVYAGEFPLFPYPRHGITFRNINASSSNPSIHVIGEFGAHIGTHIELSGYGIRSLDTMIIMPDVLVNTQISAATGGMDFSTGVNQPIPTNGPSTMILASEFIGLYGGTFIGTPGSFMQMLPSITSLIDEAEYEYNLCHICGLAVIDECDCNYGHYYTSDTNEPLAIPCPEEPYELPPPKEEDDETEIVHEEDDDEEGDNGYGGYYVKEEDEPEIVDEDPYDDEYDGYDYDDHDPGYDGSYDYTYAPGDYTPSYTGASSPDNQDLTYLEDEFDLP